MEYAFSSSPFRYLVAAFIIVVSFSCSSHREVSHDFSGTSSASLSQSMAMCGEGSREFGFDSLIAVGDFPSWLWTSVCREVCASGAFGVPCHGMEQKLSQSVLDSFPSPSSLGQGCSNLPSDTGQIGQSHLSVPAAAHGQGMRIAIYGGHSKNASRLSASSMAYSSRADSCSFHEEMVEDVADVPSRINFLVPLLIFVIFIIVLVVLVLRKCPRVSR